MLMFDEGMGILYFDEAVNRKLEWMDEETSSNLIYG